MIRVAQPSDDVPLEPLGVREIGDTAVWTLSSAKPGFGVYQLRDGNMNTYWQSDGPQPHCVNIHFPKKVALVRLEVYSDLKLDESYTPSQISVRCGTNAYDLREVMQFSVPDPNGWMALPLCDDAGEPMRTSMVQVAIIQNHQNGRDTHVRQVCIYGPRAATVTMMDVQCSTPEFSKWATLK